MDPIAPPPQPGTVDPRQLLGLSIAPQAEQWLLQRLKLGQSMRMAEPHHVESGAGPAAAWGLADAVRQMMGAHQEKSAYEGLQGLQQQRLKGRQGFFDLMNEDPAAGVPELLKRPGIDEANALRKRSLATTAAMTGDEVLSRAGEVMLKQQQQDREYAQMVNQIQHQKDLLDLERRKVGNTEKQQEFERGHTLRTEQDWATTPVPELGGFTHTSKHTGESWLIMPGQTPIQISKGTAPGATPDAGGPLGAAAATGGKVPNYVKLNEAQTQAAVRGSAGATGLIDALEAGFPTTSALKSLPQTLGWKAAEHGMPQLTPADDQARVAAWDAVFDPVARMRAGLRIPEEQMSRMRMELRPNPGEAWDNQVKKAKRILDTFRAEAQTLPPIKSGPILEELDRSEAMLPKTKAEFDVFNKNAVAKMRAHRAGKETPQAVAIPPRSPGAPLRKGASSNVPLKDRVQSYYGGQ